MHAECYRPSLIPSPTYKKARAANISPRPHPQPHPNCQFSQGCNIEKLGLNVAGLSSVDKAMQCKLSIEYNIIILYCITTDQWESASEHASLDHSPTTGSVSLIMICTHDSCIA